MQAKFDSGAQRMRAKSIRQRRTLAVLSATLGAWVVLQVFAAGSPDTSLAAESAPAEEASDSASADLRVVIAYEPDSEFELGRCLFEIPEVDDVQQAASKPPQPRGSTEHVVPPVDAEAVARDAAGRLVISGVIYGRKNTALINGMYFREGEMVEGFRVIRISPTHVLVERDGVHVSLEL